ncbi:DUF2339 domain-containing protein [Aestuariivivens sediminicola]|uniref:DUF2339 domain-containing protein n=1 Tax=Aestuariivivens sediminicola TaxID=2913560 RepID=UPI001F57D196|nr:DUF2339 domain-containing protein [Aestuariivivens sediminicola]
MTEHHDRLNALLQKLESLLEKQDRFSRELNTLRSEINELKSDISRAPVEEEEPIEEQPVEPPILKEQPARRQETSSRKLTRSRRSKILGGVCSGMAEYYKINLFVLRFIWILLSLLFCVGILVYLLLWIILPLKKAEQAVTKTTEAIKAVPKTPEVVKAAPQMVKESPPAQSASADTQKEEKSSTNLEKFIGENLINKIGIIILILGVGIGAKYTIENDLISPLTRIILGYLVGLGLLAFGIRLKRKYLNFSAVLVSGAMAILYVITYLAYVLYDLFPEVIAFCLMLVFTVFTVFFALKYSKQIIAHIGLVGAYAVPFLLGDTAEDPSFLFSYMLIINIGILVIAFKKYWKGLYISSFALTWLIFSTWYATSTFISSEIDVPMALIFIFLFFTLFYATFLAFKLIQKEKFDVMDILLLLANSFIFYGFGYDILDHPDMGGNLLGLFTLGNGLLHAVVSLIIYKQKLGDRNLFYLVSGLVLLFITIAIPVQLDGNWVTLLWIGEAALLFWIGRTKNRAVYENIGYGLMVLATLSLVQDWTVNYTNYWNDTKLRPFLNPQFLTSLLFIAGLLFISVLDANKKYKSAVERQLLEITSFLIPAVLIGTIYFTFRLELENYWYVLYQDTREQVDHYLTGPNFDVLKFKTIWVLNYSLLFVSILSFVNIYKIKNRLLGQINIGLIGLAILVFLTQGLYTISLLRDSYLMYEPMGYHHIIIRYLSFIFLGVALFACYKYIHREFMKVDYKLAFDILIYTTIIWIASSELIHWLDMAHSETSYKLGLSILWGVYSLILISLGIWKTKKHLRIAAITLFSVTLLKLFLYDIAHLNTISKTIVFVSLGILLLIISFLYNKFKHKITNENEP